MSFPWRLYLAALFVGVFAGLIGGAFHALLDQAASSRDLLHGLLSSAPIPGWLLLMLLGALVLVAAMWLVRRFAPETAGSGVQEVEAILAGERQLRWRRVLPIKFIAGTLAVGSGLVLGREGPTIHMGAALGQLASERLGPRPGANRALIAAGAAAGLASAFNAPLAAIVFVTEELREHVEYRFATIQSVILACCAAVIVSGWMLGQGPDMPMPNLDMAPLHALPLFLVLGVLIGALGVLFNRLLLGSVAAYRALGTPAAYTAAALTGLILGALIWFAPATVGGGETLVENLLLGQPALFFLLALLAVRLLTTVGSYGLGLPGGIFAPMLALGTLCGAAFAALVSITAPALALEPEVFAVAAMGALFAATVRAPLTGIILVIELTGAQALALPIILTCLSATFTAEGLGGRPIYSSLLGLQNKPALHAPIRRIASAAMILLAFIAIERIDVAREGTGMEPTAVLAQVPSSTPTPISTSAPKTTTMPIPTPTVTAPASLSLSSPSGPALAQVPAPAPTSTATATRPSDRGVNGMDTETRPASETAAQPSLAKAGPGAGEGADAKTAARPGPGAGAGAGAESGSAPEPEPEPETDQQLAASATIDESNAAGNNVNDVTAGTSAATLERRASQSPGSLGSEQESARGPKMEPAINQEGQSASQSEASAGLAPKAAATAAEPDLRAATATPNASAVEIPQSARFSIQLISFRDADSLARFAQDEGLVGRALKIEPDGQPTRWHAVLIGAYADRAAAEAALRDLPADLKRLDPIIRSLTTAERLVPIQAADTIP
ncbi:H(+)/Cl(-) exchange transporter ClcA [Lamprobacter modestohalophilus]|uniref:H(+)/Cl(-) exchange transporter ClcA n=1 Tax=Lamprobacter modestohalophilus TaxID=1064514 RepID=UPI002ADEB753|nr:H(+)/Cl(-) exchange transporter ClcA [Lamprobacter modestohalophilus]MEA1049155.1 H(+)/Cl(-) exchange transporter ClcA [Lamprobacter modestohalophilus]